MKALGSLAHELFIKSHVLHRFSLFSCLPENTGHSLMREMVSSGQQEQALQYQLQQLQWQPAVQRNQPWNQL